MRLRLSIDHGVRLWDAINDYVVSCRGKPDKYVYGNTPRMNAVAEVEKVVSEALESLTTWRPISEPPSAEVHAWCGGWFLFEREYPTPGPEPTHAVLRVDATRWPKRVSSDWARYLPIPPSDERRG